METLGRMGALIISLGLVFGCGDGTGPNRGVSAGGDEGEGGRAEGGDVAARGGASEGEGGASDEGEGGVSQGVGGAGQGVGGRSAAIGGSGVGGTSQGQGGSAAGGRTSGAGGSGVGGTNQSLGGSSQGVGGGGAAVGGATEAEGGATEAEGGASQGVGGSTQGGGGTAVGEGGATSGAGGTAIGEGGTSQGEGGTTASEGGSAGVAGALDPMVYRAVAWDGTSGEINRFVVTAWDRALCRCSWLDFELISDWPYGIGSGVWGLSEARVGSDRDVCDRQMYSGGGDLAASVSGTVEVASDVSQLDLDLDLVLPASTVQTEAAGCVVGVTREDCRYENAPVTERAMVVRDVCDGVEIQIYEPDGFYVGAMTNVLWIGESCWSIGRSTSVGTSLTFLLTDEEFAALPDGVAIESEYGSCQQHAGASVTYGILDRASVEKY
jgi:hypothetical protein